MTYNLFLDDIRVPGDVTWVKFHIDGGWTNIRTVDDFKNIMKERGLPKTLTFDYDLHNWDGTGLDCAKWRAEYIIEKDMVIDSDFRYYVHSLNEEGGRKINHFFSSFLRQRRQDGKYKGPCSAAGITTFGGFALIQ